MAEERFLVRYAGEGIQDARIDARELGMSLVGFADLLKAIQATQPDLKKSPPVSLEVHATEEGSFIVDLILVGVGTVWEAAKHSLLDDDTQALLNLSALLGVGIGTLGFIAKYGIPLIADSKQINASTVRVWTQDGSVIEMPEDVFLAIRDRRVVEAAEQAVSPLEEDGIDSMEIRRESEPEQGVVVRKEDVHRFAVPDEALPDDESEPEDERVTVSFLGISFDNGRYRIDDGESEYAAELTDAAFLEAVLSGRVTFNAQDQVIVTVRHEKYRTRKQTRTRHVITRVHRVYRPGGHAAIWDETRDRKHG